MNLVEVGAHSYGELNVLNFSNKYKLYIGNYCSIASGCNFLLCGDHKIDTISSFPFKVKVLGTDLYEATSKGNIVVDDDVWIGQNTTILSGVHIGQGAVVAAGSVVNKDVPPYAIVGGVPAKLIKNRFEQSVIDYLLTLDYSSINEAIIREHIDDLYISIDGMEVGEVKNIYSWFPKKI